MSADLEDIQDWAAAILAQLSPSERKRVNRAVAMELRRNETQRIASQQNPDGAPFAPRRARKNLRGKKGQVRRKMFARLRTAKHLRINVSETEAKVGYTGRAARIAWIHQSGGTDRPSAKQAPVRYPRRRLLGFTDASRAKVMDVLIAHLAERVR